MESELMILVEAAKLGSHAHDIISAEVASNLQHLLTENHPSHQNHTLCSKHDPCADGSNGGRPFG